ncbi:Four helix bundle sensory module for signal transduction [Desulfonispora thiosulfatigenes DSM 11270]|uniref:Four helix bundle sensory module for signal transduction n=1 Tax=Desulfonispora thiosulfatigenes DSM 11270 TaxID=656914 RepID=A0A1W1V1Q5_DESTI|nr:MCP four helix bundle domain-containing protein [Desulfonispora thiosulfatigenes]SMB87238.1 Four helix bundle sensory module for signal transduction [Desulfonispora thiosulfatigenes DSM 11270]
MSWFKNLKIGTKILICFLVVIFILGISAYSDFYSMQDIMQDASAIESKYLPNYTYTTVLHASVKDVTVGERGLINECMMERDVRKAQYDHIAKYLEQAQIAFADYDKATKTATDKQLWESFIPEWNAWNKGVESVVEMSKQRDDLIASD